VKSKLQDVHCTALRRSRFAAAKAVPLVVGTIQAMQAMPSTSSISSGAEYEDVDAMLNEVIASPVPPL
jgi:hypothetical protein